MLKKLKLSIVAVFALGMFAAPVVAAPAVVSAQNTIQSGLCQGADQLEFGQGTGNCSGQADETALNGLIAKIVNIISVIVGIVAVIMIIFGGFKYITSGGDSGKVSGAKNTILYAIIGLVIVALAQFIVRFVLGQSNSLVN
mgnify:CR=1 FL=1